MMNLTKKIAVGAMALGMMLAGGQDSEAATKKVSQPIPVVSENGYMVLKDTDPNRSTIVCELERGSFEDEAVCVNVYDKNDRVYLDDSTQGTEDAAIGEIVQLTFNGDWVERIKYNTDRIGNLVNGQEVKKQDTTSSYKVTKVTSTAVYGVATSPTSGNAGIYLEKKQVKFSVKKGDTIKVTFKNGVSDDIADVQKHKSNK